MVTTPSLLESVVGEATERCEGCGATVPHVDGPVHPYMVSAPGCWAKYGEVCAHHLADPNAAGYRQLCADAYAVQHPGVPGPQAIQSVGGHLVSLYAQVELDMAASRASVILSQGLRQKGFFSWLAPPAFDGVHTVLFMLDHLNSANQAARAWASSAWTAWSPHHAQVRLWYEELSSRANALR